MHGMSLWLAGLMTHQIPCSYDQPINTTCPYCGVGCGVVATCTKKDGIQISGDPDHPANQGRLCSKGTHLGHTLWLDDRLLHPLIDGKEASWDEALTKIASQFQTIIERDGPDAIAMYVSGQFLTEDYYVANKFMKGALGTANIDTNSRLCMASTVAGHKRAFGADTVPNCYEDIESAELIVLVGSNLAWCHPILFQRIEALREERPALKVVCIDPRKTTTAESSDHHIALAPGTDVALFNGLLTFLNANDHFDHDYIDHHIENADACLEAAARLSLAQIADITQLSVEELLAFYELFGANQRVVTLFSQGVNQSSAGTDKVNAILNCHLFTGRIGKEGAGPLSLTGQPNAMGGREVGGLANQLACHMELDNAQHREIVRTFWGYETIAQKPGLKAVELFEAVERGDIQAIWIMATNPVDSMPDADFVKLALQKCPLVIVSDVTRETDTAQLADILLPSAAWGEKSGTVTNSERRISRQNAFLHLPGQAKPDWWQITQVAQGMGYGDQFSYTSAHDIFIEYAQLSAYQNEGQRDFDISGLSDLSSQDYDALKPTLWPCIKQADGSLKEQKRFFQHGGFYRPNKKALAVETVFQPPRSSPSRSYPFSLNTGRIRDQWHTMTRTAKTSHLLKHISEPFVEINPEDALAATIKEADIVKVKSPAGSVLLRAKLTKSVARGHVFAPFHWSERYASNARVDKLVAAHRDPVSGQPESKITPVNISLFRPNGFGYVFTRKRPDPNWLHKTFNKTKFYWAVYGVENGYVIELAGAVYQDDEMSRLYHLLEIKDIEGVQICEQVDSKMKNLRRAYFDHEKLLALMILSPQQISLARSYITSIFNETFDNSNDKFSLLYGHPPPDQPDKGEIICSCFNVGEKEIVEAAQVNNIRTVKEVGDCLKAGTNCGSCRSEIMKILERNTAPAAAK